MTANNNDVLNAIAGVINCRDHRRGRKPQWNVLIWTDDKGTVHVNDMGTGCNAIVGKRAYKKRTPKHGDGTPIAKATLKAIKQGCADSKAGRVTEVKVVGDSVVRVSPITGKPVRKYTKRVATPAEVKPTAPSTAVAQELSEIPAKNALETALAGAKALLVSTKVAHEGAKNTDNKRVIDITGKLITEYEAKIKELEKQLEVFK